MSSLLKLIKMITFKTDLHQNHLYRFLRTTSLSINENFDKLNYKIGIHSHIPQAKAGNSGLTTDPVIVVQSGQCTVLEHCYSNTGPGT